MVQADQRNLRENIFSIRHEMSSGLQTIERRVDTLNGRIDAVNDRVGGIEARIETQMQSDIARAFDVRFDQRQAGMRVSIDRIIEARKERPG
jgi:hypothetical protein